MVETKEIEDKLVALPQEIEQQQRDILDLTNSRLESEEQKSRLEMQIYVEVSEEVDDSGKKKYSNETTRKAETNQRLESMGEYTDLENVSKTAKNSIDEKKIVLERQLNEFSAYKALARMRGMEQ